jgi:hypothetical protein
VKLLGAIDDRLGDWIAAREMFFVATAPLAEDGHVNVSPKGPIGTLGVRGPHEVAYVDLNGSGAETIAHLRENGRICLMLCAFDGPRRIVRLHGTGTVALAGEPGFDDRGFASGVDPAAHRAVVTVAVERIAESCGYGVPLMAFDGLRPHTTKHVEKRLRTEGPDAFARKWATKNTESIDGLPTGFAALTRRA